MKLGNRLQPKQRISFAIQPMDFQSIVFELQSHPSLITAGQMVALRTSFTALTPFRTRQLLETPVESFDLSRRGTTLDVVGQLSDKQVYRYV